jgi:hypothetical protein
MFPDNFASASHFWLLIANTPQGPFDIATLQRKLSSAEITLETLACPLGSETWLHLEQFLTTKTSQAIQPRVNKPSIQADSQPSLSVPQETKPGIAIARTRIPKLAIGTVLACLIGIGAVAVCLVWPSGYNLASRSLPKGTIIRDETSLTMKDGTVTFQVDNQAVVGRFGMEDNQLTEIEVLEVAGKVAIKLKQSYLSDVKTFSIGLPNEPERSETTTGIFHNRAIFVEKVAGLWKQTLIGVAPNPAQTRALQMAWVDEDIYPDRRLQPGETWTVTGPRLRKFLGMEDALSFQGTGTFTLGDIVTRDREPCVLVHAQLEFKTTTVDDQNQELLTEIALSGHSYRSLVSFLDVACELSGQMKATGTIALDQGQMAKMSINGPVTMRTMGTRR